MKMLIEMLPENYDLLMNKVPQVSVEYAILKNGVVVNNPGAGRIIDIACELSEAESLLHIAQKLCPEVAPQLEDEIRVARILPRSRTG
jgi:hypothetical protein